MSGATLKVAAGFLLLVSQTFFGVAPEHSARIDIDAAKVENTVDPRMYGQFVEDFFEGVQGPLWNELIRNRGFEEPANEIGLSRYWEREPDDRNHDPSIRFVWDSAVFFPVRGSSGGTASGHSMHIAIEADQWDPLQQKGVSQGRIPIQKGISYKGYLWLKTEGFQGHVTVALAKDQTGGEFYASVDIPVDKQEWTKYEFNFSPTASDPLAKLSILFHGTGQVWLDQVSLMPGNAVDGVRADVFEKIKALHPSKIRWPGGNVAQNYHWMRGVGKRDERSLWIDRAWWDQVQTSDFGTDEFIQMCRDLGTEPSITVNVDGDGATVEEAAAWVEYANGPATSKYGKMRADNGHTEPYHVRYWEVGNEIFGNWEIGHTTAESYAQNLNRYVAAMKAVDPNIEIIASGAEDPAWNRTLLKLSGQSINYVAIHHYYGDKEMKGDTSNLLAHPLAYAKFYSEMREIIKELEPDRPVRLDVNEWNTALPMPSQESMLSALYAGRMMNLFERNGDEIAFSAVSDLVNGWSGGVIQASRNGLFVTPTYLVNKLYSDHLGTQRLSAHIQSPTFETSLEGNDKPTLDAVVTRSNDGKKIFVKAVNTDLKAPLRVVVHLSGAQVRGEGDIESIAAASPAAVNDFSSPSNVQIQSKKIKAGNDFDVDLPSNSVSVITIYEQ